MEAANTNEPVNIYNHSKSYIMNPIILVILILIIVACYAFSSSLGSSNLGTTEDYNGGSSIFGVIIMTILIILILVNALQYFFNISVTTYIQGLFTPKTKVDIVIDQGSYKPAPTQESKFKKQVFNIPGNYYTYNDAKALCSAYGAELAKYNELEQAYNTGAEWCNYGWSANQLALFPTQKKTYDTLQTIPGHENDCGRPGINGGYIANPNVKFGVNCYGYKPKMRSDEEDLMKTSKPYPETAQDIDFQKKVDAMKNNLDQILISPFNRERWGSI